MRKSLLLTACVLALSGCIEGNRVLDDRNYGMDPETEYGKYQIAREAALTGEGPVPQMVPKARPLKAPTADEIEGPTALQIAEREAAIVTARTTSAITGQPAYVETSPTVPDVVARPAGSGTGGTVVRRSGRGGGGYYDPDTGQRLPSAPAQRSTAPQAQVAPAAAPQPAQTSQNTRTDALTHYAFAQTQAPGTGVYTRSGGSSAEAARACARFPNANAAQLMFLSAGGPQDDPYGLDPDGDGFVCGWDPAPYRVEQL
ncbi:hypothetical protein [Paracoccus sp. SCSIO 75233]|uniref:hypothetical protein n=1 Tax=Paracoccus sp. SCSIO 75233 TaxID=3017782 RepID=UPI0022F11CAE|nr:hypothetical protein [Paracoccus sp. SCSIO 75233]WBU52193.1 hypothetical protein PAF12_10130 [Paracoccus sp. SCSIO 75233]